MDKLPVTACMLVKNEADRLSRVLPSLVLFEEILVFDSGSEDQSIQMCLDAGAKVEQVPWEGFGATRKKLFSAASSHWVFWIDADEVVTADLARELMDLFAGSEPEKRGYEVNRIVRFEGRWIRHGEWFPDWNLRLFRTDSWSMEELAVHERVDLKNGKAGRLEGLLEHHTYRSWDDLRARSKRYALLWATQKSTAGRCPFFFTGWIRSSWKFFRALVLRLGFLDGGLGFRIAWANALEVRLKYKLLHRINDLGED
ncbi:MAG: glycosyltransferase family 2 protein [Opitutae bacterium]|nr:glycosyltransferase family 2 protein [Opitutae bacterium]MBT5379726.1 glycosyltransferase family 2 protein [Opitutae bacterium]MBT5692607.1 glycosyltransferase family 2 protein [Opitutae bacterium]MBT6463966.1 glycosyltransferase family 2 protein [Opitutae bacterium]MBT6956911.1 glycosyltransferase family 2 protein [Opitutae bacterium]